VGLSAVSNALGGAFRGALWGVAIGLTGSEESLPARATDAASALLIVVLQWVALRARLPRASRWIAVDVTGEAVGLALIAVARLWLRTRLGGPSTAEAVAEFLLVAVPPVIGEWLLLRTYARQAWRWLVANALWLALYFPIALAGSAKAFEPAVAQAVWWASALGVASAVAGFVAAAILGVALVWLLKHPKERREQRTPGEPAIR
jgi:hypothetical protein